MQHHGIPQASLVSRANSAVKISLSRSWGSKPRTSARTIGRQASAQCRNGAGPAYCPLRHRGMKAPKSDRRRHSLNGNVRRGEFLRDGGVAEAEHRVTGLTQTHGDRGKRCPIPATKRGPKHEYPLRRHLHNSVSRTLVLIAHRIPRANCCSGLTRPRRSGRRRRQTFRRRSA